MNAASEVRWTRAIIIGFAVVEALVIALFIIKFIGGHS